MTRLRVDADDAVAPRPPLALPAVEEPARRRCAALRAGPRPCRASSGRAPRGRGRRCGRRCGLRRRPAGRPGRAARRRASRPAAITSSWQASTGRTVCRVTLSWTKATVVIWCSWSMILGQVVARAEVGRRGLLAVRVEVEDDLADALLADGPLDLLLDAVGDLAGDRVRDGQEDARLARRPLGCAARTRSDNSHDMASKATSGLAGTTSSWGTCPTILLAARHLRVVARRGRDDRGSHGEPSSDSYLCDYNGRPNGLSKMHDAPFTGNFVSRDRAFGMRRPIKDRLVRSIGKLARLRGRVTSHVSSRSQFWSTGQRNSPRHSP